MARILRRTRGRRDVFGSCSAPEGRQAAASQALPGTRLLNYRLLAVRYERKSRHFAAFLALAATLICYEAHRTHHVR